MDHLSAREFGWLIDFALSSEEATAASGSPAGGSCAC
jgi:hypothetical protein